MVHGSSSMGCDGPEQKLLCGTATSNTTRISLHLGGRFPLAVLITMLVESKLKDV